MAVITITGSFSSSSDRDFQWCALLCLRVVLDAERVLEPKTDGQDNLEPTQEGDKTTTFCFAFSGGHRSIKGC